MVSEGGMDDVLVETLEMVGMSRRKAKVYLAVLEIENVHSEMIGKRCGLEDAYVEKILLELKTEWFVKDNWHEAEERRYFAQCPEKIIENYHSKMERLQKFLPRFLAVKKKFAPSSRCVTVYGKEAIRKMLYDNCMLWTDSIAQGDQTWRGFQDERFLNHYRDRVERYYGKHIVGQRKCVFSNRGPVENEIWKRLLKKNNRAMKELPDDVRFKSTTRVLGEYVVIVNCNQREHYAVQIYDPDLSQNMRTMLRVMREVVEPLIVMFQWEDSRLAVAS